MVGTLYVIPRGGFGNILFNYMVGYSLSKKYRLNFVFTKHSNVNRKPMSQYVIFKSNKYIALNDQIKRSAQIIREKAYWYTPIKITNNNKNYILDGYFQSFKYSAGYISEIKTKLFSNHPEYPKLREKYTKLKSGKQTILLHVRRGDYLRLRQFYPTQCNEYYQHALENIVDKIGKDYMILVFSDDIPFVSKWGLLSKHDHKIVDIPNPEECFMLMTMCDHFVLANSTFSLLAYYFRDFLDAYMYAPKRWFGSKGPKHKMEDLLEMSDHVKIL